MIRSRPTWADLVLVIALLAVAAGLPYATAQATGYGSNVTVRGPGGVSCADLDSAGHMAVEGRLGDVRIEIGPEGARVAASPCPTQRCVDRGPISLGDPAVVCVPSGVALSVEGGSGGDVDCTTR